MVISLWKLFGRISLTENPGIKVGPLDDGMFDDWLPLWRGYQDHYGVEFSSEVNAETWRRLHDDAEPMHLLGAFDGDRLVGIVHYLFHRSTWTVGDYCYLQDLFTIEEARGRGAGEALIHAVYEAAQKQGASRVYWLTHEGNTIARGLYDKLADNLGFIQYRKVL